ncbi:MAG: hypothetical protein WBP56_04465 [Polyangia bacterium]
MATAANFVFRLHVAALEAPHADLRLYPVMDGLYATTKCQRSLRTFLEAVFGRLCSVFSEQVEMKHRFLVKAGVAYGAVFHGSQVNDNVNTRLAREQGYAQSILLGMPMAQAFACEKFAPPFGIYIDESARAFSPDGEWPFHDIWWHWYAKQDRPGAARLEEELTKYFAWCEQRSYAIEYSKDRIAEHSLMATQYFAGAREAAQQADEADDPAAGTSG